LQYTLVADEAKRVSKLSTEQIKAEVCAKLSRVFPSVGVPEPLDILVTGWDDNPLFLGAYSFMPV
jgi:monoamine oxidase